MATAVMDSTTTEDPGLHWRLFYTMGGTDAVTYRPEPASPQECRTIRSASASETPPADSASDLPADRWALDFMARHHDPSEPTYYPAMVLSAFVQAWPRAFELDELPLDPWDEFMLWPGGKLECDEELDQPEPAESQQAACVDRMYVHDRQTYIMRIYRLTGLDASEAVQDLGNGDLSDLWHWTKDELLENDHRATSDEIASRIDWILSRSEEQ